MNPENYKPKRKGQPKRNSATSKSRVAKAKEWTCYTTPKLREIYSTKIEWAIKTIPKIKAK